MRTTCVRVRSTALHWGGFADLLSGMKTRPCLVVFLVFFSIGLAEAAPERSDKLRKAAERGDANAQCNLGIAYYVGAGSVAKDTNEAVKWFRKAAEQVHTEAQFNLGIAYWFGEGVRKDQLEAVNWYRKAAEQGLSKAQYNLGCAYGVGAGVIKDPLAAVNWYLRAAEQGVANAQYSLGIAYWLGEGVQKDFVEALAWLNLASASGCEPARGWRDTLEKELNRNQSAEATQRARELMALIQKAARARDATP